MNAFTQKFIFIAIQLFLISSLSPLFAQSDSIKTSYHQESSDSSDYNYHRKYQYLDINLKDETKMFKISIVALKLNHANTNSYQIKSIYKEAGIDFNFTFEKKISPTFTFLIDNRCIIDISKSIYPTENYSNSESQKSYFTEFSIGVRYYFQMNDRIRKGISGNNCNGVYASFNLWDLTDLDYQIYSGKVSFSKQLLNTKPPIEVDLGLQKRLNNFSFIDTKLFFQYIYSSSGESCLIGLNFRIGLGWGWK